MIDEKSLKNSFQKVKKDISNVKDEVDKLNGMENRITKAVGNSFELVKQDITDLQSSFDSIEDGLTDLNLLRKGIEKAFNDRTKEINMLLSDVSDLKERIMSLKK